MDEQEEKKIQCHNCKKDIYFSHDILTVERAVRGEQIVPLGKMMFFCSENCVSQYFSGFDTTPGVPSFRPPY